MSDFIYTVVVHMWDDTSYAEDPTNDVVYTVMFNRPAQYNAEQAALTYAKQKLRKTHGAIHVINHDGEIIFDKRTGAYYE